MNKIVIDSDISYWGYSSRWLRNKLDNMSGDVEVELASFGGDVFEGIAMYNMLKNYDRTKGKVTTVVSSHAMSIASLLFLAGSKKKAHDNSTIMIHKAWTWLAGNADELEAEAKILSGIDAVLANTYSEYMKKDKEEILKVMSNEGWYIGKEQLLETGFVDEFIESDNEIDMSAKSNFKSAMDRFAAKAKEEGIKPNIAEAKVAILECSDGKCPITWEANPTASGDNSKKNTIGANMEFNEENFKILVANKDTLNKRMESLNMQLETANVALETKNEEMEAIKAEMTSKLSEAVAKSEDAEVRVREALNIGVNVETAVSMLKASTAEEASKLANEFRASIGASNMPDDSLENEEAAKKEAEDKIAMAIAKKYSV